MREVPNEKPHKFLDLNNKLLDHNKCRKRFLKDVVGMGVSPALSLKACVADGLCIYLLQLASSINSCGISAAQPSNGSSQRQTAVWYLSALQLCR